MSKNNEKKSDPKTKTEETSQKVAAGNVSAVRAIKNKLFADVPVKGNVRISGLIKATEMDEGNYGTFTRFLGNFYAKVGETVIMAGKLYVPSVAETMLVSEFEKQSEEFLKKHPNLVITEEDPEEMAAAKKASFRKLFPGVEFGLLLEKTEDKSPNNARGFSWSVKPLLDISLPKDKYMALLEG